MKNMSEQQQHLIDLLKQQKQLITELNALTTKTNEVRDLLLKVQGAIEYLNQTGVQLPESNSNEMPEFEEESKD